MMDCMIYQTLQQTNNMMDRMIYLNAETKQYNGQDDIPDYDTK